MAYDTNYANGTADVNFIKRCVMASLALCQVVKAESTGATNHANRVALMKLVAAQPLAYGSLFALHLGGQGISQASSDAQMDTAMAAIWDTVAGVA